MTTAPMQRWQNLLALGAVIAAACALAAVPPGLRLALWILAVGAIVLLLALRLRAHAARRDSERTTRTYARIARIREQRARRRR